MRQAHCFGALCVKSFMRDFSSFFNESKQITIFEAYNATYEVSN